MFACCSSAFHLCLEPTSMKVLFAVGMIVLVLGILSFLVPLPHSHHHAIRAGDLHVGVKTQHNERVPPAVSAALVVVGAGIMIAGRGNQ